MSILFFVRENVYAFSVLYGILYFEFTFSNPLKELHFLHVLHGLFPV